MRGRSLSLFVLSVVLGAGCGSSALTEDSSIPPPASTANSQPGVGGPGSSGTPGPGTDPGTNGGGGGVSLVKTPGNYSSACDGSGGVSIDGKHFLVLNDEDQIVRIFQQGGSAPAVQELDVSEALDLASDDEADFEDAARVGNRIYVVGSHGRKKSGSLDEARYKFWAIDISGAVPSLSMKVGGSYGTLLEDMLDASNWKTPDEDFIDLLDSTSQLDEKSVASLAPKDEGTNIEGLAALPGGALAIGFRNPVPNADAVVVTLLNADDVLKGEAAKFGEAIKLKLGGFGIRGMAWSEVHQRVLLLSGPHDESNGPFALWTWTGAAKAAPIKVSDVTAPANAGPEAVIPYPGTKDVQILFDMSAATIAGGECSAAPSDQKRFTDVVIHVD